jgi:hypothetical protein
MAAAMGWSAGQSADAVKRDYYARLFGVENTAKANDAYRLLEEATLYAKSWNYNIGFTGNWVFRNSTDVPGYYWRRLIRSRDNFQRASDAFEALARSSAHLGQRQAQYLADLCRISALHVQAVYHLQNAKLPLFGYKAWPVTQEHASWPPPEKLEGLVKDAEIALDLEKEYMRVYAKWVKGCDEQGQLCLHHQGVIEPFAEFATALAQRLKEERKPK